MTGNRLFEESFHDRRSEPFHRIAEALSVAGMTLKTADCFAAGEIDILIFPLAPMQIACIQNVLRANPGCRLVYHAMEEPVVCSMHGGDGLKLVDVDRVFTWQDDLVDNRRILRVTIPQPDFRPGGFSRKPFGQRRMIAAIYANKTSSHPRSLYEARISVLKDLHAARAPVDLYGIGWETSTDPIIRKIWRGTVTDKSTLMQEYRFVFAYENSRGYRGDVTEKMLDVMAAGAIPIYCGAPNAADYVPADCFVDANAFQNAQALWDFLRSMSEEEFNRRLDAIEAFMREDFGRLFSGASYADVLIAQCRQLQTELAKKRSPFGFFMSCVRAQFAAGRGWRTRWRPIIGMLARSLSGAIKPASNVPR